MSPLVLLGTVGLLAGVVLVGGVLQKVTADPSAISTDPPFVLELSGPARKHYEGADSAWYGIDVRLCIRSDADFFTYVGATAELLFGDGTRVQAANGHGPGPRQPGTPSWLTDMDGWIDKATLGPKGCVRGYLVFHSISAGDPVRLDWNGATVDLGSAFGTGTSPASPHIGIANGTTLTVTVFVNGRQAGVFPPGVPGPAVDVGALPPLPWTVEARSPSGRVLTSMDVEPGDVRSTALPGGVTASQATFGRVDLSCGRLTIWTGDLPPSGPPPDASAGTPGDCAP